MRQTARSIDSPYGKSIVWLITKYVTHAYYTVSKLSERIKSYYRKYWLHNSWKEILLKIWLTNKCKENKAVYPQLIKENRRYLKFDLRRSWYKWSL